MLKRQEILDSFGFPSYRHYLASHYWRGFRERYARSGLPQVCLGCGAENFHLHHLTYDTLGFERVYDVIPLCSHCHDLLHGAHQEFKIPLSGVMNASRYAFGWSKRQAKERLGQFDKLRRRDDNKRKQQFVFAEIEDESLATRSFKRIADNLPEFTRLVQAGVTPGSLAGRLGIKLYYVKQFIYEHPEIKSPK